jgi:hypothetical protein
MATQPHKISATPSSKNYPSKFLHSFILRLRLLTLPRLFLEKLGDAVRLAVELNRFFREFYNHLIPLVFYDFGAVFRFPIVQGARLGTGTASLRETLPHCDFRPCEWRNRSSWCAIRGPVAIGALRASPRALAILCAGCVLADLSLVRSGCDFALIAFLGACAGIIGGLSKGPAGKQEDGEANFVRKRYSEMSDGTLGASRTHSPRLHIPPMSVVSRQMR